MACRVVRRLANYTSAGPEVFGCVDINFRACSVRGSTSARWAALTDYEYRSTQASTLAFSRGGRSRGPAISTIDNFKKQEGVHVQVRLRASGPRRPVSRVSCLVCLVAPYSSARSSHTRTLAYTLLLVLSLDQQEQVNLD